MGKKDNNFDNFNPAIDVENIFNNYSDKEIFSHYLKQPVSESRKYHAPYRNDKVASCTMSYSNGKWWFRDWGYDSRPYDIVEFVQKIHNLSFKKALQKIYFDLDLQQTPSINNTNKRVTSKSKKSIIKVTTKSFTKEDKRYLSSYGINKQLCNKYRVYSIQKAISHNNSKRYEYIYHKKDPALGYYFGRDNRNNQKWKIYFYKRPKNIMRFMCNTSRIQGWVQIPNSYKLLINTKSLKDVMCIDKLGYPAIAPQAENFMYYDYIIDELKLKFNNIITLYDNDDAGIRWAKKLYNTYNIPYMFLDKHKDISDLIKSKNIIYAKRKLKRLIQSTLLSI